MKTDFYIKDEGYADVKVLSNKAKIFCDGKGYDNDLLDIGDTYCGQPVWKPGMTQGMYQFGIKKSQVNRFIKMVEENKFTVESEL